MSGNFYHLGFDGKGTEAGVGTRIVLAVLLDSHVFLWLILDVLYVFLASCVYAQNHMTIF